MHIDNAKIIVLKIGSSNLVDSRGKLKEKWLRSLVSDIEKFRNEEETIDKYKKRYKERYKEELEKAVERMKKEL